jgi:hypothetical protein
MTDALRSRAVLTPRKIRRALGAVVAVVAAAAVGVVVSPGTDSTVQAVGGGGGEFHSITPTRVFDSRDRALDVRSPGIPAGRKPTGPLSSAPEIVVPILGKGGVPASADVVLGVVVNITVINPSRNGYLRAFGTGIAQGDTSVVNFVAGQRVPNTAILRPGADGRISLRFITPGGVGTSHVAVDVSGWFSTNAWGEQGARIVTNDEPARIFDSREAQFGARPLGDRAQVDVRIRGAKKMGSNTVVVPNDPDVVGVIVNLTGVNWLRGSGLTYASFLPERIGGGAEPPTSNLNLDVGDVRANLAIVPLPAGDDDLTLYNFEGPTHLIVDVVGYLLAGADPTTSRGRLVPLVAPFRVFDTREPDHYGQRLGPARAEDWSFDDFVADVTIDGEWVGDQAGLFGNLTATGLRPRPDASWVPAQTFLTAYPSPADRTPPNVSNLNLGEDVAVPNMTLLRYGSTAGGDHQIAIYNADGYVHYLLDVYAVVLS